MPCSKEFRSSITANEYNLDWIIHFLSITETEYLALKNLGQFGRPSITANEYNYNYMEIY